MGAEMDMVKIQSDVNKLVERRISKVNELKRLKSDKASISEDISGVLQEFESIDTLLQEKIELLNKHGK